jgi:thiol-disulfide isomerase/thioredoxin
MGKASRTKRDGTRQQKIAAQRAAARRAEIRNRVLMVSGVTIVIIAVVLTFVVVKLNSKSGTTASGVSNGPTGAALASVVTDTTSVPASTLDKVGAGSGVSALPVTLKGGSPLTSGGKPEVLYMGAEYCPYCAAERWAMVVALSRFGTFSGLSTVHSGNNSGEPYPNTPTWTFLHATYTSKYLVFTHVEMQTNIPTSGGTSYTTLQTPTSAQQALLAKYDAPPYVPSADNGAIPFIDLGNEYMISGASYSPQVLQGKSWSQIATALQDPTSPIAEAVDGTANYLTATICKLTGNQPATACTPVVKQLEAKL